MGGLEWPLEGKGRQAGCDPPSEGPRLRLLHAQEGAGLNSLCQAASRTGG